MSRRVVVQGLGVAAAAASLGACFHQPEEKILAYTTRPEWVRPGVPLHFATTLKTDDGYGIGVIVRSNEGRPTKVEGNPDHPWSLGATSAIEQAQLYELYNPDRARTYRKDRSTETSRREALAALVDRAAALDSERGRGLAFLVEPDASPLRASLLDRIRRRYPNARFFQWDPLQDTAAVQARRAVVGGAVAVEPNLQETEVLVSIGADLLMEGPGRLKQMRELADGRVPDRPMKRLYAAESPLTVTGMFADHRLRARPSELEAITVAFARGVVRAVAGTPLDGLVGGITAPVQLTEAQQRWVSRAVADFVRSAGRAALVVGRFAPAGLHALALAINAIVGRTIQSRRAPHLDGFGTIAELARAIEAKEIGTLVISAVDPVRTAPGELGLGDAIAKVPNSVYLAFYEDETAKRCGWTLPRTHPFEEWGDAQAPDGTVSFVQPLTQPIFDGVSETRVLGVFAGEADKSEYELLRALHASPEFDEWIRVGVQPSTPPERPSLSIDLNAARALLAAWRPPAGSAAGALELELVPDGRLRDGRFAHNPWLQELPDPVTKITWGHAALMSDATAKRLKIESGNELEISANGRTVKAAAWIVPGHADDAITLALGHGQTVLVTPSEPGDDGDRARVGDNAFPLRSANGEFVLRDVKVKNLGGFLPVAFTQQGSSQHGRELALVRTRKEWAQAQNSEPFEHLKKPEEKLYDPWQYETQEHRWGMAIDLARCTGCSACMVACQAENNIPAVGPDQIRRGREMHWLRIDRYFDAGPDGELRTITQPVACVHCEFAPCEYVCPVNATVHSPEGLNEQVYNRCIGTRYCSNNCPYKVRRFNFHDWRPRGDSLERSFKNPDVTVRSRGVMEKCTYCVQRIERARIDSRMSGKRIEDGDIVTACQQACPTRAIVFGDLNDHSSEVHKLHEDRRSYELLHKLDTRPRTRHLARVTNESESDGGGGGSP